MTGAHGPRGRDLELGHGIGSWDWDRDVAQGPEVGLKPTRGALEGFKAPSGGWAGVRERQGQAGAAQGHHGDKILGSLRLGTVWDSHQGAAGVGCSTLGDKVGDSRAQPPTHPHPRVPTRPWVSARSHV